MKPVDPHAPATPLEGTRWELAAYRDPDRGGALVPAVDPETLEPEWARVVAAVRQAVTIFGDGVWSGSAGCNGFGDGTYAVDGQAIRVELGFSTLMGCEEPLMRQEDGYAAGLRAARRYAPASFSAGSVASRSGTRTRRSASTSWPWPTPPAARCRGCSRRRGRGGRGPRRACAWSSATRC